MSVKAAVNSYSKRQEDAKKKQAGELPPDLDQDGKMINPHNPDFITKVPWYLGESGPTLKHHSVQKNDHVLSIQDTDFLIKAKQAKLQKELGANNVYRKGACKNCGAMTHKEKDCVERPRSSKKAAWKSGTDIAPNEVLLRLEDHGKVNYSTKRDQWQGYDADEYAETVERFNRLEEERLRVKAEQKARRKREAEERIAQGLDPTDGSNKNTGDGVSDSDSELDSEEDEEKEDLREFIEKDESARDFQARSARQGGVGGAQHKVTVRNLRLREDTPKYLHNLALDSAFYDPKARSMRADPLPDQNPEDAVFAGDNFIRHSGDAVELARTQVLCWDMQARGESIDLISNPSQMALMKKVFTEKKSILEETKKKALLAKYGGEEHLKPVDPRLALGQSEAYVEYSRDGRVVKGAGKASTRTKYEEDVFLNNHTSVWGSYFCKNKWSWGFACCHSLVKNSYCVGESKRAYNDTANSQSMDVHQTRRMLENKPISERVEASAITKRSDVYGESSAVNLDETKVQEAIRKQELLQV